MVRVATLWNEIENPNLLERGRRKGEVEEEDKNDVIPLSSNEKFITIAPPTTTTFPSPIPSGGNSDGDHDSSPPAIIDTRKWSQRRHFSLLRQWESWEVAADESLLALTGFLLLMVWGFGVWTFRCKWEWECVLVSESEKWETCVFLNSRCHVKVPRWNRKMGYSSSPSSSTTKSGR